MKLKVWYFVVEAVAGRGPGEDPPGVQSDYLQQAGHGGRQNPRPGGQGGPPTSSSVSLVSESQVRGWSYKEN